MFTFGISFALFTDTDTDTDKDCFLPRKPQKDTENGQGLKDFFATKSTKEHEKKIYCGKNIFVFLSWVSWISWQIVFAFSFRGFCGESFLWPLVLDDFGSKPVEFHAGDKFRGFPPCRSGCQLQTLLRT
jgi:hypothetical protein